MRSDKKRGLLRRAREGIIRFFEDLKKDSISQNPEKPVDCCNPPEINRDMGKRGES